MSETKIRIVGEKKNCHEVLEMIRVRFRCKHVSYSRAPTRYTRDPKANCTIYVVVKRPRI